MAARYPCSVQRIDTTSVATGRSSPTDAGSACAAFHRSYEPNCAFWLPFCSDRFTSGKSDASAQIYGDHSLTRRYVLKYFGIILLPEGSLHGPAAGMEVLLLACTRKQSNLPAVRVDVTELTWIYNCRSCLQALSTKSLSHEQECI